MDEVQDHIVACDQRRCEHLEQPYAHVSAVAGMQVRSGTSSTDRIFVVLNSLLQVCDGLEK